MVDAEESVLIVGLGNPGSAYETTRHNIGHAAVKAFGKDQGWTFTKNVKAKGKVAHGTLDQKSVYLLLPLTYMNESGISIQKCLNYYKIPVSSLLVVVDDIYLPLGKFRYRDKGSSGGHNGMKSVEEYIGTTEYQRLRVGIGDRSLGTLEEHVLSPFSSDELAQVPQVIKNTHAILGCWLQGDGEAAKEFAGSIDPNMEGEIHETSS